MRKICEIHGVRTGDDNRLPELWLNDSQRLMVVTFNEGGYCATEMDLYDLIDWAQAGPRRKIVLDNEQPPGAGILSSQRHIFSEIDRLAIETAKAFSRTGALDGSEFIEFSYPTTDDMARDLGITSVAAWWQMLGFIIAKLIMINKQFDPSRIRLIPRRSDQNTNADGA